MSRPFRKKGIKNPFKPLKSFDLSSFFYVTTAHFKPVLLSISIY